jgi:hypothetical protein
MKTLSRRSRFTLRRSSAWLLLSCLGAAGAGLFASQPAIAQTTSDSGALPGLGSSDQTATPFSGSSDTFGAMFDLMHKMQQGSIRSQSEFSQDQQNSIGTAANDFRTRQMQLLHQQGQAGTANSTLPGTPAATTSQPAN